MSTTQKLDQAIRERMAASQDRWLKVQTETQQRMKDLEAMEARFDQVANNLAESVVQPRLRTLTAHFDNAQVSAPKIASFSRSITCDFKHTNRFPATTTLEIGIRSELEQEELVLDYRLKILPMLMSYRGEDSRSFTVKDLDESPVGEWLDGKLLEFVETYPSGLPGFGWR